MLMLPPRRNSPGRAAPPYRQLTACVANVRRRTPGAGSTRNASAFNADLVLLVTVDRCARAPSLDGNGPVFVHRFRGAPVTRLRLPSCRTTQARTADQRSARGEACICASD